MLYGRLWETIKKQLLDIRNESVVRFEFSELHGEFFGLGLRVVGE